MGMYATFTFTEAGIRVIQSTFCVPFCHLLISKKNLKILSGINAIAVSNNLDPDQARHFVRHDLCSKSWQMLICYFPVSSADNFCKQFGPRPGPTKCRA